MVRQCLTIWAMVLACAVLAMAQDAPACDDPVESDQTRYLRQLTLDLFGRVPTEAELEAVVEGEVQVDEEHIDRMLESDEFAKRRLNRDEAVGEVDRDKLNVHGGSVALGHPFAATGARMVLTMAHELANTDANTALLGICAAGGLGAGAVMEAVES